jgi:hypothetical protein
MKTGVLNSKIDHHVTLNIYGHSSEKLRRSIIIIAILNLFIVSLLGLTLRAYPFYSISFPLYKNLLHAHSHFAFGGWVMPALLAMVLKYFPEINNRISYRQLKNISLLMFISSYGMLLSFPFQGYAFASIAFSSLSILSGFYQAYTFWRASREYKNQTPVRFLRAGLIYLTLSAIGPLATGPLIVTGNAGTPLYFNSIYFFLHFQYNGWFSFAILAILYKMLYKDKKAGRNVFLLLNISCVPAYFLSTLWSRAGILFNIIGGFAAFLQLTSVILIVSDLIKMKLMTSLKNWLLQLAMIFFAFKTIFQFFNSFQAIADIAYRQRNFTIAYLHMVLLGFVTLFIIGAIIGNHRITDKKLENGILLFLLAFILTETLLIINACGYNIAIGTFRFQELMFIASALLPLSIVILWQQIKLSLPGKSIFPNSA